MSAVKPEREQMKLQISPDLSLPIDAVTGTFCIVGIRGSGKSTTAAVMAEEMLRAKQQIIVLDPKDDWWGLRSSADGKSEGLPITILGGTHQDAPLEYTAGALVAELILNERISVILSTKHLSDGQRFRFTYDFCDYLYKHCREPMHMFLDEADQFAPQEKQTRILRGDNVSEAMMLNLVRRVIKQGRTSGLGISLITQSPATLDKRVMNMCETLIAMRIIGAQDFDAVERWFKVYLRKKEDLETIVSQLPTLKAGVGVFYSPAWLEISKVVQFRMTETFDSRKTPKVGERRIEPKVLAPVDLSRLSERMAATIEKVKAEDWKEWKKKYDEQRRGVVRLEKQLAARPDAAPEIERVEVPVIDVEQVQNLTSLLDDLGVFVGRLEIIGTTLRDGGLALRGAIQSAQAKPAPVTPRPAPASRPVITPRALSPTPSASGEVSGVGQKILNALAQFEAMGVNRVPKVQVAFMSGYSHLASKGFANAMGSLRSSGYISYPDSDSMAFTDAGRELAGPVDIPLDTADMQDRIRELLGGVHRNIVDQLIPLYPDSIDKTELAAACGYGHVASKGFANAIGRLRTLGFVDYPETGKVVATDLLFPAGLV